MRCCFRTESPFRNRSSQKQAEKAKRTGRVTRGAAPARAVPMAVATRRWLPRRSRRRFTTGFSRWYASHGRRHQAPMAIGMDPSTSQPHPVTPDHNWSHLVTPGHQSHPVTLGRIWSQLVTLCHTWTHLVTLGHILVTPGDTWSQLLTQITFGHTWSHLATLGHTQPHLVTLGHIWSHPVTLGHTPARPGTPVHPQSNPVA